MSGRSPLQAAVLHLCATAASVALLAASIVPAQGADKLPSEKQWRRDVARVMKGSHAYIDRRTAGRHPKLAINLDIDNSSLASHYRRGTAVPAVRSFALYAHRHGVALLFNTARAGAPLRHARAELTKAGYPVKRVCGRKSRKEPTAHGKQRCRARFRAAGYTIIANVGNRATDFSGTKNYGRAFRLPNYHNQLS
jgi:HAD superfamily, subfamily IIIB (Acid phosphatase)